MSEVEAVATPLDAQQAENLLADAFHELTGAWPGSRILALLLGLSDLETATWKSMRNFNFGNVIAISENQPFYIGEDSGNTRRFRVYDSAPAGALGFVNQLLRDSRKGWRSGLLSGEPETFIGALAGDVDGVRYFEADRGPYLAEFKVRHAAYALPSAEHVAGEFVDDGSTIPIYPAEVQTWVIALPVQGGGGEKAPLESGAVTSELAALWPEVQRLIPGPTSDPTRLPFSFFERDGLAFSVQEFSAWLPPDDNYVLTPIQFDYLGTERRMPWIGEPFRIIQVWRVEEHVPESRVNAFLRTLWESARLTSEDVAKATKEAAQKAASSFGFAAGLIGGAALLIWFASRKNRSRTR